MNPWLLFALLSAGYTLAWFLFNTLLFILSKGTTPSMKLSFASVLGIMSSALHMIIATIISQYYK